MTETENRNSEGLDEFGRPVQKLIDPYHPKFPAASKPAMSDAALNAYLIRIAKDVFGITQDRRNMELAREREYHIILRNHPCG